MTVLDGKDSERSARAIVSPLQSRSEEPIGVVWHTAVVMDDTCVGWERYPSPRLWLSRRLCSLKEKNCLVRGRVRWPPVLEYDPSSTWWRGLGRDLMLQHVPTACYHLRVCAQVGMLTKLGSSPWHHLSNAINRRLPTTVWREWETPFPGR